LLFEAEMIFSVVTNQTVNQEGYQVVNQVEKEVVGL
jgi:hypothetical protein